MTTYQSKPHTVEAFRFDNTLTRAPKWFVDAVHNNRASVTLQNDQKRYITLYTKAGNMERAMFGDWVCMNSSGKIFAITDAEFQASYLLHPIDT